MALSPADYLYLMGFYLMLIKLHWSATTSAWYQEPNKTSPQPGVLPYKNIEYSLTDPNGIEEAAGLDPI